MEPTGRVHRRFAARVKLNSGCGAVEDKEMCCAAIDRFDEPCVPAVTRFTNGKVCMNSQWVVRYGSRTEQREAWPTEAPAMYDGYRRRLAAPSRYFYPEQAACPAKHDPAVNAARPRTLGSARPRLPALTYPYSSRPSSLSAAGL